MSKCSLSQCAQGRESSLSVSCKLLEVYWRTWIRLSRSHPEDWVTLPLGHNCVSVRLKIIHLNLLCVRPSSLGYKIMLTSFYTKYSLRHADMEKKIHSFADAFGQFGEYKWKLPTLFGNYTDQFIPWQCSIICFYFILFYFSCKKDIIITF